MIILIKIILAIFMTFMYNSPLNCEETIKEETIKEDNTKEDNTDQKSKDKYEDYHFLKLTLTALPIFFQLGIDPNEPTADKTKYFIALVFVGVVSTMFGRWLREKCYGTDPKTQAKIEEILNKEITKLTKNEDE